MYKMYYATMQFTNIWERQIVYGVGPRSHSLDKSDRPQLPPLLAVTYSSEVLGERT